MYKIIIIVLFSVLFLFKLFLNILEYVTRKRGIPEELSDVYDEETYLKWKNYKAENVKIDIISSICEYIIFMVLIIFNIFAYFVRNIDNKFLEAFIIIILYFAFTFIFDIVFNYIRNMKIEEKYGFNKTKMKTFVFDQIKNLVLSLVLFTGLTMMFIAIYESMGDYILLLFSGILFVFVMFISFIYPFISRINNKFVSLEDGELRTTLTNMLEKYHYQVRDIKVMDASRRTTKSNAYFTGFGKSKTIVLYDNLLNQMTNEEIVAIFAHEMGHGVHKDTLKGTITSFISIILYVLLAWLLTKDPDLYLEYGFNGISYGFLALILVNVVIPFVSTFLGLFTSFLSRKHEYAADKQAFIEGYGDYLVSGLKKLFRENLGNLNPHPLIVALSYSHPTLLQRVNHINKLKEEKNNE